MKYRLLKQKVERIETFGSQNPLYVFMRQVDLMVHMFYLITLLQKNAKFVGRGSNQPVELSFDVYDLNHLKNPPKKIDVVKLYKPTIRDTNWTFRQEEDIRIMEGIIWFFLW